MISTASEKHQIPIKLEVDIGCKNYMKALYLQIMTNFYLVKQLEK